MPISKVQDKFRFLSILFLHSTFNIEKNCVSTILKTIHCKTINSECLVPQDIREGRVSQQLTFIKCAHVSSIVMEANHNGAVLPDSIEITQSKRPLAW